MNNNNNKKLIKYNRLKGTTNFYPTYVDGNKDLVTSIESSRKSEFQTIIPRYELSMSETRDQGTGPNFLEIEYKSKNTFTKRKQKGKTDKFFFKIPKHKKRKIRLDFWG